MLPRMKYLWPLLAALSLSAPLLPAQDTLDTIESEGMARNAEGRQSQERVNELEASRRHLLDDYRARLKIVEGLETYISMLGTQLDSQRNEVMILEESIAEVVVIERQILPLMARMVEGLDEFIALDVPFLIEERQERVDRLRTMLNRSDVTVAEKFRRVFEAYQIETDYGRTIETYTDKLELAEGSFDARFLRIGRLNLLYSTVGAGDVGYWDREAGRWQTLESMPWRRLIEQGVKVANQEIAPELIHIALVPSEVETL